MNYYKTSPSPAFGLRPRLSLSLLALGLISTGTGCFRATGYQRSAVLATEIPASGGDRVAGPKADAGPGDFYLGNDFVEIAVDGAIYGDREAIAGAPSGGSIVDLGSIALDTNYHRTSMPVDWVDRLTPVVNQDPEISVVIDQIQTITEGEQARVVMQGGIFDPKHHLTGATWDGAGRVAGVAVSHLIKLGKTDRFFSLETTLTNNSGSALGIRSLGDFLLQKGGGYKVNAPANEDFSGNPLNTWGVEIPGTSFATPLTGSVKAPMVAFMGVEPGGASIDCHASFGILPEDADAVLVASDPQPALTDFRPSFPRRVVVGGLAQGSSLASGASLSFRRRLYSLGGTSQYSSYPAQASGLFNVMSQDRRTLRGQALGGLYFSTYGTAERMGPLPAEIRFERNVGTDTAKVWKLERVEWWEPYENQPSIGATNPGLGIAMPEGTYRIIARNREPLKMIKELFRDGQSTDRPDIPSPLVLKDSKLFQIYDSDIIAPERDAIVGSTGSVIDRPYDRFYFVSRPTGAPEDAFQPARITLVGINGTADPSHRRQISLASYWEPLLKDKAYASRNVATYSFLSGNQGFGASMPRSFPMTFSLAPGLYTAYASRGPLTSLEQEQIKTFPGQANTFHYFILTNGAPPANWTSFDLPGPGLNSTGGYHSAEKLSSALAEGVQVLGFTEEDRLVNARYLYDDYRKEFSYPDYNDDHRTAVKDDPFIVAGRTTTLAGYGAVTSLFTEAPSNSRAQGARSTTGWSLADFLTQGQGQYVVAHRPRGPQGIFTLKGFDPTKRLDEAPNTWWNTTGSLSQGAKQGGFDALELLRAEYSDTTGQTLDLRVPANATAWFQEFQQVRADWFALLNQQSNAKFTKGLGLSGARFSQDTTVGAARTYLKASGFDQDNLASVLTALRSGAAVASTGPMLEFTVNGQDPGTLVAGPVATVTVKFTVTAAGWVPVDQLRVVVNGQVVQTIDPATLTVSPTDSRVRSGSLTLTLPATGDAWVLMEAGVPLTTTGAYRAGTPWAQLMKGIYPIAVTNPVFVDVNGGGYKPIVP